MRHFYTAKTVVKKSEVILRFNALKLAKKKDIFCLDIISKILFC